MKLKKNLFIVISMLLLCSCPEQQENPVSIDVDTGNERVDHALNDLTGNGTSLPSGEKLTQVINNVNPNLKCHDLTVDEPAKNEGIEILLRSKWGSSSFKKDGSFKCMDYLSLLAPELDGLTSKEDKLKKIYKGGRIVVHHSAGPAGDVKTVQGIQSDHQSTGYQDVKYHYLIDGSGKIYEGRKLEVMGAHAGAIPRSLYKCENGLKVQNVANDYDFKAIGIMLTGNFEVESPSDGQYKSLKSLINHLQSRFGIEKLSAHQHVRKSGPTDCPGVKLISNMSKEMGLQFSPSPSGKVNDINFRQLSCSAPSVSCK